LLVDNAQAEINFVGLLKVGLHLHNLGKCFLGVFQRSPTVIEDTNSVPKFGFLYVGMLVIDFTGKMLLGPELRQLTFGL